MLTGLSVDLRDALRALTSRPAFALMLVLTLGLGIGATTTVYSFVYALLLRPYPYEAPEQLVRVQSVDTKNSGARRGMSLLDIEDVRRRATTLAGIGAYTAFDTRLLTDGPPVVVSTSQIHPQALTLLGVPTALGRWLLPEEDLPGGDVFKAVISHQVWHDHFGGAPDVIGQPLRTDRRTYTIVGVAGDGFGFPDRVGIWTPMEAYYANLPADGDRRNKWRGARWYETVARLAPGVSPSSASASASSASVDCWHSFP
jgi:hypothetical protein